MTAANRLTNHRQNFLARKMEENLLEVLNKQPGAGPNFLSEARKLQAKDPQNLAELLINKKLIPEVELLETFSTRYQLPFWSELALGNIQDEFADLVPIHFLKKHLLIPLRTAATADTGNDIAGEEKNDADQSGVVIAINSPTAFPALDDLVRMLDADNYQVVFAPRSAILEAISMMYDLKRDSAEQLVQDMEDTGTISIDEIEAAADLTDDVGDAPIIKLVNNILTQSIKAGASDIHIEPYDAGFKVRHRVDGILYDLVSPPKWVQAALTSRIKIMAKLDIAEKRLPQDGRMEVSIVNQKIDIRVSTIPTSFGERVVLRLLNKTSSLLKLTELGLSDQAFAAVEQLITAPNGIILVTGPTGSGKTTTLYSVLSTINKPGVNIITIEDPVEYQIKGISQIQVNPKIDLTFAKGLRSIVRQDPDVILVGEIRDQETAEIAVQSALTGHLVFSTLHTNDSASAVTRLVDIGVEPFLISSSVLAIMAQRLVRVLCDQCKAPFMPGNSMLESLGLDTDHLKGSRIHKAAGCEQCFHSGFRGRMGIFELLQLDENIKSLILTAFDSNQIMSVAQRQAMTTLRDDGIEKVLQGQTTFEEVLRVAAK